MRNVGRWMVCTVAWVRGDMWMLVVLVALSGACTPRVEVTAPDKPITINLNVKIDHEIRVKVDKDLDQVLSDDSGLF